MADEIRSSLRYRRMRAPRDHGTTFSQPSPTEVDSLWRQNLGLDFSQNRFHGSNLERLRCRGREEAVRAALAYTRVHRNVPPEVAGEQRIVMAGHQPMLFHPGVWYKNFVLAELGQRWNALAINLVVDNDNCGFVSIRVPRKVDGLLTTESLAFDAGGASVPFEERKILDPNLFRNFGSRAAAGIRPFVQHPIIKSLWPHVVGLTNDNNLGLAMARGRHAFEAELGLNTLELPISHIARTPTFAIFVAEMLLRLEEFVPLYNLVLREYRQLHKIRSRFQPVPELQLDGSWTESPFWIWRADSPQRRSLFVEALPGKLRLSNRADIEVRLDESGLAAQLAELQHSEVRIRPKALMTTLFSRLFLSDLFIHGIGGAKYDQLTEEIARRFLGIDLPANLAVTATMKLFPQVAIATDCQITELQTRLRQLKFQPERFLANPPAGVREIVSRKQDWITRQLSPGDRLERHRAIVDCNRRLQPFVDALRMQTATELTRLAQRLEAERLMNSREYSFCLFDEMLPAELRRLSRG